MVADCVKGLFASLVEDQVIVGTKDGGWSVLCKAGDDMQLCDNSLYITEGNRIRVVFLPDYDQIFLAENPGKVKALNDAVEKKGFIVTACFAGAFACIPIGGIVEYFWSDSWVVYLVFVAIVLCGVGAFVTVFSTFKK
ncbi:hypothetical protein [Acetobacter persici]|uniref:hypothetical protein n=1 Tax=Acetobacter persici TaxID=1076596 RepID=UPI001BAB9B7A|nr:hypothetical protein [Acetobacter persici]MBS1017042.1 hypothetical protein [Acetobacter persici]